MTETIDFGGPEDEYPLPDGHQSEPGYPGDQAGNDPLDDDDYDEEDDE